MPDRSLSSEAPYKRRQPPGRYIVLVGPDGCGKSTLAAELARRHPASIHRYWRPSVLPMARTLLGRPPCGEVNTDPHNVKMNSGVRATLRLAYYWLDFLLGYFILVKPALNRGSLVIFERGWHDMAVDFARYGLRGPGAASVLLRLLPPVDLLLIVKAPAQVVHDRKPELPVAEIDRQYAVWNEFRTGFRRCALIDNSLPLDSALAAAESLIYGS